MQTQEHFLPVQAPRADRPSRVVYCIAATEHAAKATALKIVHGELPDIYYFGCDAVADWRRYPVPLAFRHRPYRVELFERPGGFLDLATSRLDR